VGIQRSAEGEGREVGGPFRVQRFFQARKNLSQNVKWGENGKGKKVERGGGAGGTLTLEEKQIEGLRPGITAKTEEGPPGWRQDSGPEQTGRIGVKKKG